MKAIGMEKSLKGHQDEIFRMADEIGKLEDVMPNKFGRTFSERIARGQQQMVSLKVPFGPELGGISGASLLKGANWAKHTPAGKAATKTLGPAIKSLSNLGDRFFRPWRLPMGTRSLAIHGGEFANDVGRRYSNEYNSIEDLMVKASESRGLSPDNLSQYDDFITDAVTLVDAPQRASRQAASVRNKSLELKDEIGILQDEISQYVKGQKSKGKKGRHGAYVNDRKAQIATKTGRLKELAEEDVFLMAESSRKQGMLDGLTFQDGARLTDDEVTLARRIHKFHETMLRDEVGSGILAKDMGDFTIQYIKRIYSPEMKSWIKQNPDFNLKEWYNNRMSAKGSEQVRRTSEFESLTIDEIHDLWRNEIKPSAAPDSLFQKSSMKSIRDRFARSAEKQSRARMLHEMSKQFSEYDTRYFEDVLPSKKAFEDAVRAGGDEKELAELGDIYRRDFKGWEKFHESDLSVRNVLDARKVGQIPGMEGKMVPPEIAEALGVAKSLVNKPEETARFWDGMKMVGAWYRGAYTGPFPAYHVRNAMFNMFSNTMAGVKNPKYFAEAIKVLKNPEEMARLQRIGIAGGEYSEFAKLGRLEGDAGELIADLSERLERAKLGGNDSIVSSITKELKEAQQGLSGIDKGQYWAQKAFKYPYAVGQNIEDTFRVWHYLEKKAGGMTDADALESVNKYLFDYTGKNVKEMFKGERKMLKRVFLFPTFTRYAIPMMMNTLVEKPREMAAVSKMLGLHRDRDEIPPWLRKRMVVPIGQDEDKEVFLSGLGLPFEELAQFESDPNRSESKLELLMSRTHPAFKTAYEFSTERDTFMQMPISKVKRAPSWMRFLPDTVKDQLGFVRKIKKDGRVSYEMNPYVAKLANWTPLSRAISESSRLFDENKDLGGKTLTAATGVRIEQMNLDDRREEVNRRYIREILGRLADADKLSEAGQDLDIRNPYVKRQIRRLERERRQQDQQAGPGPALPQLR